MRAALSLFAENGFHTTSVSDIAAAAAVSKGLTYNYFSSKEALLLALISEASDSMFEVADSLAAGGGYQITLHQFLDRYRHFLKTNRAYLSFQLSLLFQPDLKELVEPPLRQRAARLLSHTDEMFRLAGVNAPTLTARRFMTELDGIALHYLSVFEDFPLDEMLQQVFLNYKDLRP